ncbi:MAG: glycosyltransferase family 4 protein [Acidobacteriota bacterium]
MTIAAQIVINGRFLTRPVTGVERFAGELLTALDRLVTSGQIQMPTMEIVVPKGHPLKLAFDSFPIREIGHRQGHLWEQLDLPRYCGKRFLVNLCNTGPVSMSHQAVVIHDAAVFAVPHAYGTAFKLAYKLMHGLLARRAQAIWTVSEFSRAELQKFLPLKGRSIVVLPEGGEHVQRVAPDDSILDKAQLRQRPFVLAVSSAQPAKNFGLIIRALDQAQADPGFDVVVAGGTNPTIFSTQGQPLPTYVKHVGYVSDGQLAALYRHAACFVFPSVYEGFGLPPLEAMAWGCPVVASRAASIPEVCGDAAEYFDPQDPRSFLDALNAVMHNPQRKAELQHNAVNRSQLWTWDRAARSLAQALQVALHAQR